MLQLCNRVSCNYLIKEAYKKVAISNFINNVFCIWLETFGWQLFFQGAVEQSSNPARFPHWGQAVPHGC